MKYLIAIGLSLGILTIPCIAEAKNTQLKLGVTPLGCVIDQVNDGVNTIGRLYPQECEDTPPPFMNLASEVPPIIPIMRNAIPIEDTPVVDQKTPASPVPEGPLAQESSPPIEPKKTGIVKVIVVTVGIATTVGALAVASKLAWIKYFK